MQVQTTRVSRSHYNGCVDEPCNSQCLRLLQNGIVRGHSSMPDSEQGQPRRAEKPETLQCAAPATHASCDAWYDEDVFDIRLPVARQSSLPLSHLDILVGIWSLTDDLCCRYPRRFMM